MIKENVKQIVEESLKKFKKKHKIKEKCSFLVSRSINEEYGNYSTNVAMILAKKIQKNPIEVAEEIKEIIKKEDFFEKVEIVKPGFINFFLSKSVFQLEVSKILKEKERYGNLNIGKGKKIQVEFISANPTGPLTIANARGGFIGDTLSMVLEKVGYKVTKTYYVNDYGNQILMLGHSVFKDSEAQYKGEYIDELNKKIKEKDPLKVGKWAAKIICEEMIKKTVERMGIKFNEWFLESKLHSSGIIDEALEILKKHGFTYEKDGAVWFKSEDFGDNRDRVLIKSDGNKTYLGSDAGWHLYKFEKEKFDKVINIWGADHHGDVKGLESVVEVLGYKGKLETLLIQFVTLLKEGEILRMSKRKGIYVTVDDFLDVINIDVARFFFLEKSREKHLNFDLELAIEESDKNPVYYVQYAYVRICSILEKSGIKLTHGENLDLLKEKNEIDLIEKLAKFPEIISDIEFDYGVHSLPHYTKDLAASFHKFYGNCKVISEDKKLTKARLSLVLATKIVLKDLFSLMGISAPEKM